MLVTLRIWNAFTRLPTLFRLAESKGYLVNLGTPRLTVIPIRGELLQGTLDLLVLKTLAWGPRHGYGIARWLEDTTDDILHIAEGSLYPALYRMQHRGWIDATWGVSEIGKRIKIYSLTEVGRAQLKNESAQWTTFVSAVSRVMATS